MIALAIVVAVGIVYFNPPQTINLTNYQSQSQSQGGGGGDNTIGTVMSVVGVAAAVAMMLL